MSDARCGWVKLGRAVQSESCDWAKCILYIDTYIYTHTYTYIYVVYSVCIYIYNIYIQKCRRYSVSFVIDHGWIDIDNFLWLNWCPSPPNKKVTDAATNVPLPGVENDCETTGNHGGLLIDILHPAILQEKLKHWPTVLANVLLSEVKMCKMCLVYMC